ncbi:MAG: 50S ribosomal protein L24e [Thermoplasmata archaeon]|nr:MAG: 50S ribosomal protein L24e [Thermoplasmata archaeon]
MARKCTFCGNEIEPGTGMMYVKKDGTIYYFCSGKCRKNMLKLKRDPKKVRWTKYYRKT